MHMVPVDRTCVDRHFVRAGILRGNSRVRRATSPTRIGCRYLVTHTTWHAVPYRVTASLIVLHFGRMAYGRPKAMDLLIFSEETLNGNWKKVQGFVSKSNDLPPILWTPVEAVVLPHWE